MFSNTKNKKHTITKETDYVEIVTKYFKEIVVLLYYYFYNALNHKI